MQHQEFEAPEELRDLIKCFWHDVKDFDNKQADFEVIPDGYAEIIFYFGSTCGVFRNGCLQQLPSPFMVGLLNKPVTFYAGGNLQIIGIRCFPWIVYDLLGLPADSSEIITFEHPMAALQWVLAECVEAGDIQEAVNLLKRYCTSIRSSIPDNSMLFKAGDVMRAAKGTLPVSQVAAAAYASIRTLERNFKQSSGYTVKDVSALMRFEQVRNRLWHYPDSSLTALAHEFGYTDQPHLSKEFKRYSGTTPKAFARKAKERQQS